MLFTIRFTDNPERLSLRQQFVSAHRAWLEANRDTMLVGGSLKETEDGASVGAMWIVEAPNKAAVEHWVTMDPFWIHGLRQTCEILHWTKGFPDGKVLV